MDVDADVRFPTDTELEADAPRDLVARIAQLYRDLDERDLQPLWTQNDQLMGLEPKSEALPWLWKKKTMWEMAERAAELITITRGGDRRVLALANPGLGGAPFATPTLWGAIQYLNPHEEAPGHRHTPGAVRFVMEGEGTWTTVDGEAIDMHEGDLIITPPWTWHDHRNGSDNPMVWFDGLDLPLVRYLDAVFFEQYPVEELQPVEGRNISERLFAGRGTAVAGADRTFDGPYSPLHVYRYTDVDATLSTLVDELGGPLVRLDYLNPVTGAPIMPTLGCQMLRIAPGERTATTRQVASNVFVVFRGAGATVIDGQRLEWEAGDMFVSPSWARIDHEAAEESDLFAISDAPVLRALGLYREATMTDQQDVVGTFEARQ